MEHYLEAILAEKERSVSTFDVSTPPESLFIKTEPIEPTDEDFSENQRTSFHIKEEIDSKLNQCDVIIGTTISDVLKLENCVGANTNKIDVEIGNKDQSEIKEEIFDHTDVCTAQIGMLLVTIIVNNYTRKTITCTA